MTVLCHAYVVYRGLGWREICIGTQTADVDIQYKEPKVYLSRFTINSPDLV